MAQSKSIKRNYKLKSCHRADCINLESLPMKIHQLLYCDLFGIASVIL